MAQALGQFADILHGAKDGGVFAGRFHIEYEAGLGGMGIVYRARDQLSGEVVALKLLRTSDPGAERRFDAEAEALERLQHHAIVRYVAHGIGEEEQRYLAMEWVEGETLGARLQRGPLDVREVVTLGHRLANALSSVHALGILHRDVKPSNVLLPAGDVAQAKMADFGLARPFEARGLTHATASGVMVGTPGYIAPEQAHGVADLDGRADLFSLGCLLFRCLADVEAFEGSRVLTALAKLLLHEPPRLTELRSDVPASLDRLVASLLQKDRANRPATAAEVRDALDDIAKHVHTPLPAAPRSVRSTALQPGATFGRYVIEDRIGQGGMGELFRARDTILGRQVALKVLHGARDQAAKANLIREARAAAALNHPNIVTIHDVGEHDGVPFLAMEHIAGKSLREYVGDPSVDLDRRIRWLSEIARGLGAAHRAGLVHGDVKPENVMVVSDDDRVKILDFGLAIAAPGCIMGTPAYMAPEQVRGETRGGRADQFAWGVTAYELVTGRRPWPDQDVVAMLASVLFTEAAGTNLPPIVANVIPKTLRKPPEERFPTMEDLVATLEASAPRKTWRRRNAVLAGIAVLALGVGGFAVERARAIHGTPSKSEALAEIAAGLQHFRDAAQRTAEKSFARAIELDANSAAAHLYSCMIPTWTDDETRAHHHAAQARRSQLGARDRALLEAYAPAMAMPPNLDASAERLLAARAAFPSDWLVGLALAETQIKRGEHRKAIEVLDALLREDPSLTVAWANKGLALALVDDVENARDAFQACLERSPYADTCLVLLGRLDVNQGRCADAERHGRTLMALPSPQVLYATRLATAIQGRGGSMESVHDVLDQAWQLAPPTKRDTIRWQNEARFNVAGGAFAAAQQALDAWGQSLVSVRYEEDHALLAKERFYAAMELGDSPLAVRLASEYLTKRDAWLPDAYYDFEILPLGVQYLAGGLSREGFQKRRQAWLDRQSGRPQLTGALNQRWIYGYAIPAATRDDAREALGALPEYLPITESLTRDVEMDDAIGRVYLLAGDLANARTYLRRGASSCAAISYPFEHTRAHLHLGMALEQSGDAAGACAAYDVVLTRWGKEPRSVSAKAARSRRAALHCSAP